MGTVRLEPMCPRCLAGGQRSKSKIEHTRVEEQTKWHWDEDGQPIRARRVVSMICSNEHRWEVVTE